MGHSHEPKRTQICSTWCQTAQISEPDASTVKIQEQWVVEKEAWRKGTQKWVKG